MFALLCAAGLTGASQAADVYMKNHCVYMGFSGQYELQTNLTMRAANTYYLDAIIMVGNGAALTIEPGTVIRGQNTRTTGVAFRPGVLVVRPGGKIYANGTASSPIIFTDEWDNNVPGQTAGPVSRTYEYRNGSGTLSTNTAASYDYSQVGNLHGIWGGVVLCGKAFCNWDSQTLGNVQIPVEGIDASLNVKGGGRDDDDSSGVFKYVQIRYGGAILVSTKEINGLTMYGVGRGTELHHVEVFNNQDDGFEWFGGTVCAKYLVCHGAGDDTFDSDAGFRGKNQFFFGVQRNLGGNKRESGVSDKGMEMDGFETAAASGTYLYTASAWYNGTLVGWMGKNEGSGKQKNVALQMRDNASPQINHCVFMDFGGSGSDTGAGSTPATLIENRTDYGSNLNPTYRFATANDLANLPADTTTNYLGATVGPAYFYKAQRPGMQAHIKDCVFWHIPRLYPTEVGSALNTLFNTGAAGGAGPYFETGGLGSYSGFTAVDQNNIDQVADSSLYMPIRARTQVPVTNRAPYSTETIGVDVTFIDPRGSNDAVVAYTQVPNDGWLSPVSFRGAFDAHNNWARGWTTMDRLGLFGASVPGTEVENVTITDFTVSSPVAYFNTQLGVTYRVKSAASVGGPYTTISEIQGTGGLVSYLDVGATDPTKFYKVVSVAFE
jgi:hypothetical protein